MAPGFSLLSGTLPRGDIPYLLLEAKMYTAMASSLFVCFLYVFLVRLLSAYGTCGIDLDF